MNFENKNENKVIDRKEIEIALSNKDCMLRDLFKLKDFPHEYRIQFNPLIQFLKQKTQLNKIVEIALEGKENGIMVENSIREMAFELLCSETSLLNTEVHKYPDIMSKVFKIFKSKEKIDKNVLDVHTKMINMKLSQGNTNMITYFFNHLDVYENIFQHLYHSGVMDLILRTVLSFNSWYSIDEILEKLRCIHFLLNAFEIVDEDMHENIISIFIVIISSITSKGKQSLKNFLIDFDQKKYSKKLVTSIFRENNPFFIDDVPILIELYSAIAIIGQYEIPDCSLIPLLTPYFPIFIRILRSSDNCITYPGINVLGNLRLKIVLLILAYSQTKNHLALSKVYDSGVVPIILDLTYEIHWNTFLHQSLSSILLSFLSNENPYREKCVNHWKLPVIIPDLCKRSRVYKKIHNVDYDYVGHLYKLAGIIENLQFVKNNAQWKKFYVKYVEREMKKEKLDLGGKKPVPFNFGVLEDWQEKEESNYMTPYFDNDEPEDIYYSPATSSSTTTTTTSSTEIEES